MDDNIDVRWMIRKDYFDVLGIDNDRFYYPLTKKELWDLLKMPKLIGVVAKKNEEVVGYMLYELKPTCIELVRLAVDRDHEGTGVGGCLVNYLKERIQSSENKRSHIIVKIWERLVLAQLFLAKHGFIAASVIKSGHEESGDDLYLMYFLSE